SAPAPAVGLSVPRHGRTLPGGPPAPGGGLLPDLSGFALLPFRPLEARSRLRDRDGACVPPGDRTTSRARSFQARPSRRAELRDAVGGDGGRPAPPVPSDAADRLDRPPGHPRDAPPDPRSLALGVGT